MHFPVYTRHSTKVGSMLAQRSIRWAQIESTLGELSRVSWVPCNTNLLSAVSQYWFNSGFNYVPLDIIVYSSLLKAALRTPGLGTASSYAYTCTVYNNNNKQYGSPGSEVGISATEPHNITITRPVVFYGTV